MKLTEPDPEYISSTDRINVIIAHRQSLREQVLLKPQDIDEQFNPKLMIAGIVTWIDEGFQAAESFGDRKTQTKPVDPPAPPVDTVDSQSVSYPKQDEFKVISHCRHIEDKVVVLEHQPVTYSPVENEQIVLRDNKAESKKTDIIETPKMDAVEKKEIPQPCLYLADQIPYAEQLHVSDSVLNKMKQLVSLGQVRNTIISSSSDKPLHVVTLVERGKNQPLDKKNGTVVIGHGCSEDEAIINAIDILRRKFSSRGCFT